MSLSTHGSDLWGDWLEETFVAQEGPEHVGPASGQGDEGLLVFASLAVDHPAGDYYLPEGHPL